MSKLTLQNIDAILEERGFVMSDPVSYKTLEKLLIHDIGSTDGIYKMLPDKTIIKCYLIDNIENYVKKDGSPGKVVTLARVCDQRNFYSNILYAVEILEDGSNQNMNQGKLYSTKASDIIYPVQ